MSSSYDLSTDYPDGRYSHSGVLGEALLTLLTDEQHEALQDISAALGYSQPRFLVIVPTETVAEAKAKAQPATLAEKVAKVIEEHNRE